ncbi:MAG: hypothetical protein MUF07_17310 [Steroidobacteraceae bacterium]|nr:hypothetical protein [Steroidobacteraceae bacterium]
MHSLEPELQALREASPTGAAALDRALELESRRLFPVRRELWAALYGAVLAILVGVGLLVRANLDRIGPVALLLALLGAALACHVLALLPRLQGRERPIGLDYVLLLGALLLGAAAGYAQLRFQWLGTHAARVLLLLAAWHTLVAYLLDSRLVLAVALGSFAAWLGLEPGLPALLDVAGGGAPGGFRGRGWIALGCALIYLGAALAHRRAPRWPSFREVYEQFAAHLGFWGALALAVAQPTRWTGVLLLAALATGVALVALRERRESLLVYAVGYATLGALVLQAQLFGGTGYLRVLAILGLAAWTLMRLRARRGAREPA